MKLFPEVAQCRKTLRCDTFGLKEAFLEVEIRENRQEAFQVNENFPKQNRKMPKKKHKRGTL